MNTSLRWTAFMASFAMLLMLFSPFQNVATAQGDAESLESEANRLTYELLELRARRKTAEESRAALLAELQDIDGRISAVEGEMQALDQELSECQQAFDDSIRSLYIRGEVTQLEVLLETNELEELWEDTDYYNRLVGSETEALERLKAKLSEIELKERDLRDARLKRERLAGTLDTEALDRDIGTLEARLSEIDSRLREAKSGGVETSRPYPDPPEWSVPAPGELLDRVPVMPPLSDFELTGIVYSGYTTSYGGEFHGRSTASGVIFNMYDYTCAHRSLPFGTWLLVTFRGQQVIVQVNDRGPFVPGRVLDLSFGAAQSIGLTGVQWTEFEILVPNRS